MKLKSVAAALAMCASFVAYQAAAETVGISMPTRPLSCAPAVPVKRAAPNTSEAKMDVIFFIYSSP